MEVKIRAMYFSGTGTTAKVASAVAYRMWEKMDSSENKVGVSGATDDPVNYVKAENINFTPKSARDAKYSFTAEDIVVFGVPVIAGRVPNVLLKFLDTLDGGGAVAVPIVLYGNRNFDDALIELRNILESKDFRTVAAAAFIGEHAFSDVLAKGRPDGEDMKKAYEFSEDVAEKLLGMIKGNGYNLEQMSEKLRKRGPVDVDGMEPYRDYYKPQDREGNHINILKVKPKLDEEKCTKCGICVELCPMGSIKEEAPGHVEGICIKCCGCVKKCPEKALYFDDEGFLYHKQELEIQYADRKEPAIYII